MAWKDFKNKDGKVIRNYNYDGYHDAYNSGGNIYVKMQYDDSTDLATTLKIHFYATASSSSYYQANGYYLYWNPKNDGTGSMYKIKAPGETWPRTSSTITISKAPKASGFSIPEFWIICTGYPQYPVKEDCKWYINISDKGKKTCWYYFRTTDWFTGSRQYFKTVIESRTETSVAKAVTDIGTGKVSITDNGDNTFTLTGSKGASGTYNPSKGPTLSWGYNTNYSSSFKSGDKKTLEAKASDATKTVYAKCVTGATYGSSTTKTASLAIKNYVKPSEPGKPKISGSKSRLTLKDSYWTAEWKAATRTNSSSSIAGYRIRVYKNGKTIPFKDGNGKDRTTKGDNEDYYFDRDGTGTTLNIYPAKNGFEVGDTIKVGVIAYTRNGKDNTLRSSRVDSSTYTVQHPNIIHIKAGGSWKEGVVYIKAGGKWIEADAVKVKAGGKWVDSE